MGPERHHRGWTESDQEPLGLYRCTNWSLPCGVKNNLGPVTLAAHEGLGDLFPRRSKWPKSLTPQRRIRQKTGVTAKPCIASSNGQKIPSNLSMLRIPRTRELCRPGRYMVVSDTTEIVYGYESERKGLGPAE